jgi:MFS family permease
MRHPFAILTPTLRWFMLGMILANIAGAMVFSLLAVYLSNLGASVAQIGLTFTLATLVPLALQIVGGWLSDTVGRLRMIAAASLAASFGYITFVIAPTWEWVLVGLCLEYISGAVIGPTYGAFIADHSAENERGQVFGLTSALFMIVGIVGPPLAGWLADGFGFRVMLAVAATLYLSATGLRLWMVSRFPMSPKANEEALSVRSLGRALKEMFVLVVSGGVLSWIFLTDGVRDIAFRLSQELQPLYMTELGGLSLPQVGVVRALFSAGMMLMLIPAGRLADKTSERLAISLGFALEGAGLIVFILANEYWGFALAAIIGGIGVGVMGPAYDSLLTKIIPEERRGVAFGLFFTSLGLISLPAPWVGAYLWESVDPRLPFSVTAIAALLTVIPAWMKFKLKKAHPELIEEQS